MRILPCGTSIGRRGFGLPGDKYKVRIKVKSWDNVLKRHSKDNIFLAKVDCEGAEKYLLTANQKLIKQIPNWIIETHSLDIEKQIVELFEKLGYAKELREKYEGNIRIWTFSRP